LGYWREVDSYQEALMRRQPKTQEAVEKLSPAVEQAKSDLVPKETCTGSNNPIETGSALEQYQAKNAQKEQQLQRLHVKNPELFNELDRRRSGMTPFTNLDAPTDKNTAFNGNLVQGRDGLRREEQQWRNEEAARDEGTLGPLRSFAANKWQALTQGSETDTSQPQRSSVGRERQNENDWARAPPKGETPPQRSIINEPIQAAAGGWHFPFFGSAQSRGLHHMAHEWNGKENTRLIDIMTDDELSMMSL
jgi:hypothetical protein